MGKALFLDLDGTVRGSHTGKTPNKPEEQYILPGRKEKIWEYKKKGYKIIAVTNQAGIAYKFFTTKQCKACLYDVNEQLGMPFDAMFFAPHKAHEKHPDTKPAPGMILQGRDKFNIDLKKSIMVGDMDTDKGAADNAGVKFMWAKDFFDDENKDGKAASK